MKSLFQINDLDGESLGLILAPREHKEELVKSWHEYHVIGQAGQDNWCIDSFIEWHNKNKVSQLKRYYYEIVQPEEEYT